MDEQNIPIDISSNKLLDWLISRRHIKKDWQNGVLKIREQINSAIQDMPEHEGILKLLSGQHIHYFHCLRIIEILKETEADTKNLFGRYGSQRMKDWFEIVSSYQRDNLYLAEAAQILMRNVAYEIPGLRKQVAKFEQIQSESEKKMRTYTKIETTTLNEFNTMCKQFSILGSDIRSELQKAIGDLPATYQSAAEKAKLLSSAVDQYLAFAEFHYGTEPAVSELIPLLRYVIKNGNTTVYEHKYGRKPTSVEALKEVLKEEGSTNEDEIDFGDGGNQEIDFGDNGIDFGPVEEQSEITSGSLSTEDGFEIVEHDDLDTQLKASGDASGPDGGVARGHDALTLLDYPPTRDHFLNDLMELEAFLKMRLYESSSESDLLTISQMQEAPAILHMQSAETIGRMSDDVQSVLADMMDKRTVHLHNIKHSDKYLDSLTESFGQKLAVVERMRVSKGVLEEKCEEAGLEIKKLKPMIGLIIDTTKSLQKSIEDDISVKYNGRRVNIVGGINML